MGRGILNIVIGGVMIAGGASGHLVLIGTSSGPALMGLGALLCGLGIYRIAKAKKSEP